MAGVDVVLGMDAIEALGGVTVDGNGVRFGREASAVDPISPSSNATTGDGEITTHTIEDVDFRAEFTEGRWVVRWVWKDQPPVLKNRVGCYGSTVKRGCQEEFDREVGRWIQEGILRRWEGKETGGVLPLMAVLQPTKCKVRPVLDFRELNDHVMCHTGGDVVDVCGETLRAWRWVSDRASIVDLKSAYLQLHVAEDLWPYQLVRYKGVTYCLTRLGFGLNSAPKIMARVLKTVLSMDQGIREATSSYIDDILVDETSVKGEE
ncbi:hypothetical protein Ahia01_000562000, partial [Argonauta hians]